ncbi:unnamed protein product, partial [Iphiclides podalirius]
MLSVIAMRRPEDEELGRGDGDEFVDISQMQLLVEAGPSGLQYGGPQPPAAQPAPYAQPPPPAATASVDDFFALYFAPATHAAGNTCRYCQRRPTPRHLELEVVGSSEVRNAGLHRAVPRCTIASVSRGHRGTHVLLSRPRRPTPRAQIDNLVLSRQTSRI